MKPWRTLGWGAPCLLIAAVLVALPAAAAQTRQTTEPVKPKAIQTVTLEDVRSVLGTPRDDSSGVSDFSEGGGGELIIAYHYYDVDEDNYETDFSSEIAPRVQHLYRRFKNLDRIRFQVITNDPSASPMWKPFSEFSMDRKTIEKLHWTWFVARDILDQVLKNKR
jgi:hypothetical protein